ncbi:MAG: ammonium transporter [Leptothrix ochracea]|uniref:ammonium transporter n=1 Tax=Leptothrix ochracea TaxID=735331 RepID=UPI0034E277E7
MSPSAVDLINLAWVAICSALVFFMQSGFALVEGGLSRAKNSINVIMKVYLGTCLVGIIFWATGWGLAFGPSFNGLFGVGDFALVQSKPAQGIAMIYQMMFATTAVSIVSGAVAERMRYGAYLAFAALMSLVIYPVYAHWVWNDAGWLKKMGFVDFAGDGVVHSIGAWCALAGLLVLGPRLGRYSKSGEAHDIPGHNLPMVALGGFILWLGWFGFNGGSVSGLDSANLGTVLINTYLGACAGGVGALAFQRFTGRPVLMSASINGSLCGLVSITAGAGTLNPVTAMVTGIVAGVLCVWGAERIRALRIDDAVDAIAVHGIGGTWGLIAAGLFFEGDLFSAQRVGVQLVGALASLAWALPVAWLMFKGLDKVMGLRTSTLNEQRGLDYTEHNELGYPEFQNSPAQLKMGE